MFNFIFMNKYIVDPPLPTLRPTIKPTFKPTIKPIIDACIGCPGGCIHNIDGTCFLQRFPNGDCFPGTTPCDPIPTFKPTLKPTSKPKPLYWQANNEKSSNINNDVTNAKNSNNNSESNNNDFYIYCIGIGALMIGCILGSCMILLCKACKSGKCPCSKHKKGYSKVAKQITSTSEFTEHVSEVTDKFSDNQQIIIND